jgi:hypothetical protein
VGGLGRGYLGLPRVCDPGFGQLNLPFTGGLSVFAPGVHRRDFEHGVVHHRRPADLGQQKCPDWIHGHRDTSR